jgi:hypothetical protein
MQRPIMSETVSYGVTSYDVTPNSRCCAPTVALTNSAVMPLICPTCQLSAQGVSAQSIGSGDRSTLHGVVFDIFDGSRSVPA